MACREPSRRRMESAPVYAPRDPRSGVLHALLSRWWPEYVEGAEGEGAPVPDFVQLAVGRLLECGVPEAGFIRLRCPRCRTERALAFSCKGRGLCPSCGARRMHDTAHHLLTRVLPDVPLRQYVLSPPGELVGLLAARGEALSALCRIFVEAVFAGIRRRIGGDRKLSCGAVVFVQRFTKTLTVFPHLHVLVLDGAYVERDDEGLDFLSDAPPATSDLRALEERVHERFSRWLKKRGYLDDDDAEPTDLDGWWIAAANEPSGLLAPISARPSDGWQVHAGVRVDAGDDRGREQLVKYMARPPFAEDQLELLEEEAVRLTFRSPTRSGQRALILHPLALMKRFAWLVPPPRQHQLRYAGVLAPSARLRPAITPAGRVSVQAAWFGERAFVPAQPVPYRQAWSRLLARVYDVDGHACPACPGKLRPVGAVLPPQARTWIEHLRIRPLESTGPPAQLPLALPSVR